MPPRRRRRRTLALTCAAIGLGAAVAGAYLLIDDPGRWPAATCMGLPGLLLFSVAVGMTGGPPRGPGGVGSGDR
jgi:hypothetical protein